MARVFVRYYVHPDSVGSLPECEQVFLVTKREIQTLYENKQIEGYNLIVVKNEADIENNLLWCNYTELTSGLLPFVCALIQPFENNPTDIDAKMTEIGFSRCAEI